MGNGWPRVRLGEVLSKNEDVVELVPDVAYREVTIRLWGNGVVLRGEVLGAEIGATRRFRVRAGQFILSRIDARNGALGIVPGPLDGAVVSNDFPSYNVVQGRLFTPFLGWMSRTGQFVDLCRAASEGTTNRVRLQEERFLRMEIALPPLPEQRRVVAKVEELAAKIEEAKHLRSNSQAEVVALLAAELRTIGEVLQTRARLGDVLLSKPRNGWSARCDNSDGGIPVLSLSAVTGFEYRASTYKRTSLPTSPHAHYWARPGDLFMSRSNTPELVGHAAIYDGDPYPCIYPDLLMRLEPDPDQTHTRFVWWWLQTPQTREYIAANAKGTSPTMKKISQGTVMDLPFPASLMPEQQRRIVAYLDGLQAKVDSLKALQPQSAAELDALLPSILDRAFKGEL